ncbi:hypothetical protein FH972_025423 [Carpinus fangiana]|uniref:Nop domain-containing protein n=1 Tax=Carpinus fangiana TaxID=176857 RepID=A0A5N6L0Z5_9ROSI|nr:hypothetical protein FH972_025423 [Carpinus fangiana]
MATLADELADDFADSGGEEEPQEDVVEEDSAQLGGRTLKMDMNGHDAESGEDEDEDEDPDVLNEGEEQPYGEADEEREYRQKRQKTEHAASDMETVARFMKTIEPVLEKIAYYRSLPPEKQTRNIGSVEENPEYGLLTQSNTYATSIDDQTTVVHKYIRDHYSARFPELEKLITDPIEYTKAVAVIGNGPMDSLKDALASNNNILNQALNNILSRHILLTVTTEATMSKGQALPPTELSSILDACRTMLALEQAKRSLTSYVQSRMNIFAPNLTTLIGSLTAAQLLNARGGLTALAETRASNIASIGTKRAGFQSGFATNVGIRNQGYLYASPLVQRCRPEQRTQAMRIVSAKLVLAARVDRVHQSADGATGEDLREQCEKRLDKLTEPPPNKGHRALPAPDDRPSKKRGGRRARKAKEATAMTDLRKAQNRMQFGKEEAETGYGTGESTAGLGMIGESNDGRIRALQVDQRTRARLSKKNAGWGGGEPAGGAASSLNRYGSGGTVTGLRTSGVATNFGAGGTQSSLAFTPKQGLELVDPKVRAEMERKNAAESDKWFKGGTFTQVAGSASSTGANGGFKKPALPMKRKAEGT